VEIGIFTRKIDGVMGGMEKQILLIATRLIESGNNVTVVTLDAKTPETFFESNPNIKFRIVPAANSDVKATIWERVYRQVRIFRVMKDSKFDVVMSFSTGSLWYSAIPAKLSRTRIVLCERTGPSVYTITRAKKYRWLIFLGMSICDAIVVQIPSYVNSYPRFLRKRMTVIPNEVPSFTEIYRTNRESEILTFGFLGRFCHQKQSRNLTEAFIRFNLNFRNSQLILIGGGEQEEEMIELINSRNAQGYIKIIQSTPDITDFLRKIDVLVHPALWEGFPNGVAEAMSLGVPVAGFSDCEGVRDLVVSGKNGWIIDRQDEVGSIVNLLSQVELERGRIKSMSEEAVKSMGKYSKEFAMQNWQSLLSKL
jgi:GalNAc-alpha-(1->4)-GalNAc-alpha-(1->3)-diNAcBac-PP-undecaprenol alpha-1,4-N-acetyl-D-galactosaminyltransferase